MVRVARVPLLALLALKVKSVGAIVDPAVTSAAVDADGRVHTLHSTDQAQIDQVGSSASVVRKAKTDVSHKHAGNAKLATITASGASAESAKVKHVGNRTYGSCHQQCYQDGKSESCHDRSAWLIDTQSLSCLAATHQVNNECSGQCSCDASEVSRDSCTGSTCSHSCSVNGEHHSCRDRTTWLMDNDRQSCSKATQQVNNECSGQCSCAVSDIDREDCKHAASHYQPTCKNACFLKGEYHSCYDRAVWVVDQEKVSCASARSKVNSECSGQCYCGFSDTVDKCPNETPELCFPGESLAQTDHKGRVALNKLEVGDAVLTEMGVYEPVFGLLHRMEAQFDSAILAGRVHGYGK